LPQGAPPGPAPVTRADPWHPASRPERAPVGGATISDYPWEREPSYDDLHEVIETVGCGLVFVDATGAIRFANERLLEVSGYTPSDIEGAPLTELAPEEVRRSIDEDIVSMAEGDARARISALRRKDGRTFPVVVLPSRFTWPDGSYRGLLLVIVDLGEVDTAKRAEGLGGAGRVSSSLDRIARELRTISLFATGDGPAIAHDHPGIALLSEREREVLSELLGGTRVPAIAKKLFISPHTVRNHLKSMYRKLDVTSQSELVEHVRGLSAGEGGGDGAGDGRKPRS
jgi:PAS domain S-box-containing protein